LQWLQYYIVITAIVLQLLQLHRKQKHFVRLHISEWIGMMRHKKVCITIIITISKPKKKEKNFKPALYQYLQ